MAENNVPIAPVDPPPSRLVRSTPLGMPCSELPGHGASRPRQGALRCAPLPPIAPPWVCSFLLCADLVSGVSECHSTSRGSSTFSVGPCGTGSQDWPFCDTHSDGPVVEVRSTDQTLEWCYSCLRRLLCFRSGPRDAVDAVPRKAAAATPLRQRYIYVLRTPRGELAVNLSIGFAFPGMGASGCESNR